MADTGDAYRNAVLHDRWVKTDMSTTPTPVHGSAAWARVSAAVYDPFVWAGERAGMRALRRAVVGNARGRTVEIGSGTGLNLAHYPDDLDDLVLAEPDQHMHRRVEKRLRRSGRSARLIDAPAERLPFDDGSV